MTLEVAPTESILETSRIFFTWYPLDPAYLRSSALDLRLVSRHVSRRVSGHVLCHVVRHVSRHVSRHLGGGGIAPQLVLLREMIEDNHHEVNNTRYVHTHTRTHTHT